MSWLALPGLTDGQYAAVCVGIAFMAVTLPFLAVSWWRRRHPHRVTGRPYDWAADVRYRQAVTVHRKAS